LFFNLLSLNLKFVKLCPDSPILLFCFFFLSSLLLSFDPEDDFLFKAVLPTHFIELRKNLFLMEPAAEVRQNDVPVFLVLEVVAVVVEIAENLGVFPNDLLLLVSGHTHFG